MYLKTNDPDEPEVVVSMFGIINGVAGVYPGHFNLGNIVQEEPIRKSFRIFGPGRTRDIQKRLNEALVIGRTIPGIRVLDIKTHGIDPYDYLQIK